MTLEFADLMTLVVLAMPVAVMAWTVTHEEIFREAREYCVERSKHSATLAARKFFYLFTCEFCFSFWVTALWLVVTRFTLLFDDWRGYVVAGFCLVWVANHYMSLYARLRLSVKGERLDVSIKEELRDNVSESRGNAGSTP